VFETYLRKRNNISLSVVLEGLVSEVCWPGYAVVNRHGYSPRRCSVNHCYQKRRAEVKQLKSLYNIIMSLTRCRTRSNETYSLCTGLNIEAPTFNLDRVSSYWRPSVSRVFFSLLNIRMRLLTYRNPLFRPFNTSQYFRFASVNIAVAVGYKVVRFRWCCIIRVFHRMTWLSERHTGCVSFSFISVWLACRLFKDL
jgi:hypothetical protein